MTTGAAAAAVVGARMRPGRRERGAEEGWALAGPHTAWHTDALCIFHNNLPHCCTCPSRYRRDAQDKWAAVEGEVAEGEEGGKLGGHSGFSCSWVVVFQASLGNVEPSSPEAEEGGSHPVPRAAADSLKSAHGCVYR